jgi:choline-sulfatase
MRRPSVTVRAVGLLLCCVACRPAAVPVSQDLTTLRAGFSGSQVVPVRVQGEGDQRRLVRAAGGELDIYVRLPADAELRYRLPADQPPASVALSAVVDGTATTLVPEAGPDGEWRAPLPSGGDGIAALRLTVPDGGRTVLVAPRIVGEAVPVPPILPRPAAAGARRPNVILYVVDTLRTDRMSLYGYGRPTSPELARRAGTAYVFEQAYAAGSFTAPSVTALLASRRASEMRGVMNPTGAARATLAEAFKGAGYATAAFQANLLCTPAGGYDRGFDTYDVVGTVTKDGLGKATAAELHERALAWVDAHRAAPFFLYVQSMDVHFPYAPPEPFRDRFVPPAADPGAAPLAIRSAVDEEAARVFKERFANLSPDRYDGAIAYADHELGRLLDALAARGLADDTIVVVTADHGEPLGDRREIFHGRSLWNELVRVPLVLWVPGLAGGVRVDEVVSLLDVAPTLTALAGLPTPPSFVGRSWLQPASTAAPAGATGELVRGLSWATVGWYAREGPWKLILDREKGPSLFHLPTDPRETTDVSAAHPDVTRYLVGRATAMPPQPAGTVAPGAGPAKGLNDEDRRRRDEALRALGYVDAH